MKSLKRVTSTMMTLSLLVPTMLSTYHVASANSVTITLLQNKPEVVNEWNTLIKNFEKSHPGITVKQVNPPNIDLALQADVAKGQVPDLVAMGDDATYISMAKHGIFTSWQGRKELKLVAPAYVKMLENSVGNPTPYALPYTINAVPVLYNVTLMKKYHVAIPKTWNQLIADAQKIKKAGGTAFYNGWKDSWTLAVPWNALTTNNEPANFQHLLVTGKASFIKSDKVAASDMITLAKYGQANEFGTDYNDANSGFANGKGVFYLQGTWVLPVLRADNPKVKIGSFVFPATNNPKKTKMVSGVDSLLAVTNSGDTAKEQAAQTFVDFLLSKTNGGNYANIAGTFSTVKGVKAKDPAIAGLQTYIDAGRVIDFDDHYYPAAMAAGNQYESSLQGSLSTQQSVTSILKSLDTMYQSAIAHQ